MNNDILSDELRFRSWVRTILIEELIYENAHKDPDVLLQYMLQEGGPSGEGFIKAMVSPFTDVLKVAKVATKDLLSIAKFNFDMITTLSPSKQAEARKKWEARNKSMESEWAEAMAPIDAAWEEGDAQLIAFMFNPAGFLGAKALGAGFDTAVGTRDMLDDAGIHLPFVSNKDKEKDSKKEKDGVVDILGTGKKLLGDLTKLFFIAHYEPAGPLIAEAGEEKEKPGNAEDGAQRYIEEYGLKEKIEKDAKQLLESSKEYVDEIMNAFEAQMTLLTALSDAQGLDSFLSAVNAAGQAGVDIGGAGLENFQGEIDNGVRGVLSNPKSRQGFVDAYLESQGMVPKEGEETPEVPDEKLVPEIEKVIFMNSKIAVQEQIYTGAQQLKEQTTDAVLDGTPEKDQWELIKKTPMGAEYISIYEQAIKKIESL